MAFCSCFDRLSCLGFVFICAVVPKHTRFHGRSVVASFVVFLNRAAHVRFCQMPGVPASTKSPSMVTIPSNDNTKRRLPHLLHFVRCVGFAILSYPDDALVPIVASSPKVHCCCCLQLRPGADQFRGGHGWLDPHTLHLENLLNSFIRPVWYTLAGPLRRGVRRHPNSGQSEDAQGMLAAQAWGVHY